ncbi:hypothetical protein PYW08_007926 [Mythimna loreyi]|uniref:Uncharacterized protein n=1 Tax=Mythimna loreyi TaxID=667449 RepID=A0ACC2QD15_9NEOP|nr:hypothetical protein PYW08_007926 [Mythimna loreyi]
MLSNNRRKLAEHAIPTLKNILCSEQHPTKFHKSTTGTRSAKTIPPVGIKVVSKLSQFPIEYESNPLPSTSYSQSNPLPSTSHSQSNPLPSTSHSQFNPLPSTSHSQSNLLPSTSHIRINLLPSTSHTQSNHLTFASHTQSNLLSSTSHCQSNLLPSTSHSQSNLLPSTSHSQSNPLPSTSHCQSNLLPSTSHSQSNPLPSTSHCQSYLLPSTSHTQSNLLPSTSHCQSILELSTITSVSELVETPRKRKLRKQLQLKNNKIRKLQAKNRYLKKKINTLQELLNDLEEKSLINKEDKLVLSKIGVTESELIKRQLKKSDKLPRTKYSSELRSFALTLHYYSAKAYKYVRKVFQTCLPHPRTLSKWYSNIDGKPGFTKESLYALKLRCEQEKDPIYCALVFDELKIKLHPEWDPRTKRYFGYVDHGFESISDNSDIATDALVFLVVGINKIFRVPIGYFLVKSTTAAQKARLVSEALSLVHETGVEIKSLTCDGVKANLAMAEELGCCFQDPNKLQTCFLDPSSGQKVSFFADPCHMLKLIRNTFFDYEYFINESQEQIKFDYIQKLHDLQEKELFYLANKLRANHIYYKTKIMNVKLATQLFSASVADSLLFCKNILNIPEFINVEATANFIKLINDLFDILDSRTKSHGFKRALSKDNYQTALHRLQKARQVLLQLYVDIEVKGQPTLVRKNILKSPRYTGFLGMLICIESTQSFFQDLVLSNKLKFIPMHKISQDHIEIFFSVIRSHGGYNDNPTARQLEAIYKKLLIHTELHATSTGTNCIPLEKITILNCTSAIEKINKSVIIRGDEDELQPPIAIGGCNSLKNEDILEDIESQVFISPFGEKVIEYIAGFSAFSALKTLKCATCMRGLLGPVNKESLIFQKSRGYLIYASQPVIDLCRICEKEIRKNLNDKNQFHPKITAQFIVTKALKHFLGKELFPNIAYHTYDNGLVNHTLELANVVMEKYTNVRLSFLTKTVDPQKCVRHIYRKLVHFKNQ